jgi:hypothetical protein
MHIVLRYLSLICISLKFICFSDIDKTMMSYQSGEKCLSVLGFTKLKNVPRHFFMGKGVLHFVARKGDSVSVIYLSVY